LSRNATGGDLSESLVLRLVSELKTMGVEAVGISGGGEPLIWDGRLEAVFEIVSSFARSSLTSSGDQLWDDATGSLSALALRVLPWCDAVLLNVPATDETGLALQMVGGPTWARTRLLLRDLVAYSDGRVDRPRLIVVVVVNQRNLGRLLKIDAELTGLGIRQIYYKELKHVEAKQPRKLMLERRAVSEMLAAVDAATISEGLQRFRANLETHGNVFVCTPTVGLDEFCIGNVVDASFAELWGGPRHRQVVEALSARSRSGDCPRECRHHTHNRIIQDIADAGSGDAVVSMSNAGLDDLV
jgi:hypothetical protein